MMKKRNEKQLQTQVRVENPTTAAEFAQRGWNHYSKKEYFRAEADFRKALELSPDNPDYFYALAMSLQSSGRPQEAVQAYEKAIQTMQKPDDENRVRYLMMTRLAKGHISRIKTGEWRIDT